MFVLEEHVMSIRSVNQWIGVANGHLGATAAT